MSGSQTPDAELRALVNGLSDGLLDDEQEARLAERLRSEPADRAYYLDSLVLSSTLQWEYGAAAIEPASDGSLSILRAKSAAPRRSWLRYAAVLLLGAGLSFAGMQGWRSGAPKPTPSEHDVATLTSSADPDWRGGPRFRKGDRLEVGPLRLAAGVVEIQFDAGAVLTVKGPAEFELLSRRSARLMTGSVSVLCPEEAVGFVLETPASNVIDLGTEFGITVTPAGASEIHVFEGVVVARPTASDLVFPLHEREAARVDPLLGELASVPLDPSSFPGVRRRIRPAPARLGKEGAVLPPGARVVFLGDRATDRETHLLLVNQALQTLPADERPLLFNAGIAFPLGFRETVYREQVARLRPTHAILEFGPEMALATSARTVDAFRRDVARLLDRLADDGVTPMLETGYPLGRKHADRQGLLDGYNHALRRLAAERGLTLIDAETSFRRADPTLSRLLNGNGDVPTFAGHRTLAEAILHGLGRAVVPVGESLKLGLLPGVIRDWRITHLPVGAPLDADGVGGLTPDANWRPLTLPMSSDPLMERLADRTHSNYHRDRARGFATALPIGEDQRGVGVATVTSDRDRDAWLNTGATLKVVWINGERVFAQSGWSGWHAGAHRVPVRLKRGENRVVIEFMNSFFVSLTDAPDWPLPAH